LAQGRTLEERLRAVIAFKFEYFAENRSLLSAQSAHSDPQHPLSPFSAETAPIRAADIEHFAKAVEASQVRLPRRIAPYLPRLLWLYQMGLLLFWVYDRSEAQRRTEILFEKSLQLVLLTLRFAGLPVLIPMHGLIADLLEGVYGDGSAENARHTNE